MKRVGGADGLLGSLGGLDFSVVELPWWFLTLEFRLFRWSWVYSVGRSPDGRGCGMCLPGLVGVRLLA